MTAAHHRTGTTSDGIPDTYLYYDIIPGTNHTSYLVLNTRYLVQNTVPPSFTGTYLPYRLSGTGMPFIPTMCIPLCCQVCICVRPDIDGKNAHDAGDRGAAGGDTLGDRGMLLLCIYEQRRQVGGWMGEPVGVLTDQKSISIQYQYFASAWVFSNWR